MERRTSIEYDKRAIYLGLCKIASYCTMAHSGDKVRLWRGFIPVDVLWMHSPFFEVPAESHLPLIVGKW